MAAKARSNDLPGEDEGQLAERSTEVSNAIEARNDNVGTVGLRQFHSGEMPGEATALDTCIWKRGWRINARAEEERSYPRREKELRGSRDDAQSPHLPNLVGNYSTYVEFWIRAQHYMRRRLQKRLF